MNQATDLASLLQCGVLCLLCDNVVMLELGISKQQADRLHSRVGSRVRGWTEVRPSALAVAACDLEGVGGQRFAQVCTVWRGTRPRQVLGRGHIT